MGLDATSVFEDVGHSKLARTVMLQYVIGRVNPCTSGIRASQVNYYRRDSSTALQTS